MRSELYRERFTTAGLDIARCIPACGMAVAIATAFMVTLLAARLASAQTLEGESHKNTIGGTVINAVTRAPVPRALVTSADSRYAKLTDSEGHFEFDASELAEPSRSFSNTAETAEYSGAWLTARRD